MKFTKPIVFSALLSCCATAFINSTTYGILEEDTQSYEFEGMTYSTIDITSYDNDTIVYSFAGREIITLDYNNEKALLSSPFWKEVVKKKDPDIANKYYIYLKKEQVILAFADSERLPDKEKRFPSRGNKERKVDLVAINTGAPHKLKAKRIPISPCVSSKQSSSGASFTQSHNWSKSLSLSFGISGQAKSDYLFVFNLSAGIRGAISLSSTGSITCTAGPGKTVQVFGSIGYVTFPNIVQKEVRYAHKSLNLKDGTWKKIKDTKPTLANFGAILFDLENPPSYSCVDDPKLLRCGRGEYVNQMNDDPTTPLEKFPNQLEYY
ncbi:uncharacterized protein RJT21DRAFT_117737 [Scheffersomyces amazonensis]|uniref:uncharacterized protein n=1 Tax=Scheffersomyces amazonensis TaxID=1078765 RepID=UPI00315C8686